MKCIIFNLGSISIQIIPGTDRCFIFKDGFPIWGGNRETLINLLKSI